MDWTALRRWSTAATTHFGLRPTTSSKLTSTKTMRITVRLQESTSSSFCHLQSSRMNFELMMQHVVICYVDSCHLFYSIGCLTNTDAIISFYGTEMFDCVTIPKPFLVSIYNVLIWYDSSFVACFHSKKQFYKQRFSRQSD